MEGRNTPNEPHAKNLSLSQRTSVTAICQKPQYEKTQHFNPHYPGLNTRKTPVCWKKPGLRARATGVFHEGQTGVFHFKLGFFTCTKPWCLLSNQGFWHLKPGCFTSNQGVSRPQTGVFATNRGVSRHETAVFWAQTEVFRVRFLGSNRFFLGFFYQ